MVPSPASILRGTIRGTLAMADIDAAVAHYWDTHDFVHHVPAGEMPAVDTSGGPVRRYGLCDKLDARLLYGTRGQPGCLLVTTPAQGSYDRTFQRFLVAPHVHDSSHVTVVTAGRAVFVVVRDAVLVTAEVGPGSVVLYPAGAIHTFVSDEEFQVASLQARYEEPEDRAFAGTAAIRPDTLTAMSYEAYRRSILASAPA